MRTKTAFLSAAALAAGVLSSMAQANVYSVNIVGYVNKTLPANQFALLANPLDAGTNDLNTLFASLPVKSSAQIWNGTGFTPSTKGSGGWSPNFTVAPGVGVFIRSTAAATNTFVGSTVGVGGSATNVLPANQFVMVGNPIPFAGTLNGTNLNLLSLPNKSSLQVWNGSGFTPSTKGSGGWSPDLSIDVAQGFFIKSATATNWVQTLQ